MQERIYILKKGTEVPAQFDGVTVPFQVPATLAEVQTVCNGDEKTLVAIFNQAHALNVQKDAKVSAMEEGATVQTIRDGATSFKYGQVRVRGAGTATKPTAAKVESAVGEDFLALLTPEQRAIWDAKMAALKVAKPAAPAATDPATAPAADTKAVAGQGATTKKK